MTIGDAVPPSGTETGPAPILGWYGDDFTGATDTLAALAQARLRALLFMRVPTASQLAVVGPLDAVGIAGGARAMSRPAMQVELAPVGAFFAALRVPVLHYKVCSTFDSAPHLGSIGGAIATLRPHVGNAFVPIVGGQPNIGRYCAFSNLFAAAGAGGVVHRIDRHPTMSRHPVTPMHEADLRRHLARQGLPAVGAFHYPAYAESPDAQDALLDSVLAAIAADGDDATRAVLFDIVDVADLAAVGRLIWQRARTRSVLAVGGSSVVQALAAHWRMPGDTAVVVAPTLAPAKGPVFALAGSLSPMTARQVQAAAAYDRLPADVSKLVADPQYAGNLLADVVASLTAGRNVLVSTAAAPGTAADTARAIEVARATAALVAQVVTQMAAIAPLRRVGIAGGDTSTQVVQALGLWGLSYQTTLFPGVTLCRAHSDNPALDGLELMLKGGQMGPDDLFGRLIAGH
jgi:uncharacterized protein YgbK (DUF1537 family)